jgi:hypothetical protein
MKVGIMGPLEGNDLGLNIDNFLGCDVQYFHILFSSLPVGEWFMYQGDSFIKTSDTQAEKHGYQTITSHEFEAHNGAMIDEEQFERLGLTDDDLAN